MPKKYTFFIIIIFLTLLIFPGLAFADETKIDVVNEVKDILWNYYVDPVPYELLEQNTLDDVLTTLNDPYTKYYNEQEFQDFWLSLEGKVGGIGVSIEKSNGLVIITKVYPYTPAARVNLQKGDIITHVDDRALKSLSMDEITELFRGKPGTYLRLKTYRPGTNIYLRYLLTRENIKLSPVESTILARDIGYIKLMDFNQQAAKEFTSHLGKLKEKGIKGLILDLRDNPGGLIGSALDISRDIIPPGPFVQLLYRGEEPDLISTVGTFDLLPMIALVNENTASSAEILAGAIQDRKAGIVVGTTTYGKASVQSVIPLVNGGALKFTSGKYLTPNGQQINKIGLKPDLFIKDPQQQVMESIWLLDNEVYRSITFQLNNNSFLINGVAKRTNIKPFLLNGSFMVPLRSTIENLGGKVKYYSPNNIRIMLGENLINLNLDSNYIVFNGQKRYLPVKPVLKSGHIAIPVRPLAELLGAKVEWRPHTGQVIVNK